MSKIIKIINGKQQVIYRKKKMKGINIHTVEGGTMPQRQTTQSIGYDCFVRDVKINEIGQVVCNLGFSLDISEGIAALIIQRSSCVKTGYRLANSIGLGDPDYKGEYVVTFDIINACGWDSLKVGKRCCQLLFVPALFADNDNVKEVVRTGGHGSTGNK